MATTVDEMRAKGLQTRRDKRDEVTQEAREMYKQGVPVEKIAVELGKKHKRNQKPYSIYTIYDYLGGTDALKSR